MPMDQGSQVDGEEVDPDFLELFDGVQKSMEELDEAVKGASFGITHGNYM